jgi:hypothetical protein
VQSIAIVLCAGSTLLSTGTGSAPCQKSASFNLQEFSSFSYWSIKPWFLIEGKLVAMLVKLYTWGNPTLRQPSVHKPFLTSLMRPSSFNTSFLTTSFILGIKRVDVQQLALRQVLY